VNRWFCETKINKNVALHNKFLSNVLSYLCLWKSTLTFWATFLKFRARAKVKSRPMCENSPNLVTLITVVACILGLQPFSKCYFFQVRLRHLSLPSLSSWEIYWNPDRDLGWIKFRIFSWERAVKPSLLLFVTVASRNFRQIRILGSEISRRIVATCAFLVNAFSVNAFSTVAFLADSLLWIRDLSKARCHVFKLNSPK
jgi:hypothetical protein